MRRWLRWGALALAALLLAWGAYHVLNQDASPVYPAGEGSAALGMVLLDDEDCVYVLAVSDQSPAHQAGLRPGDYILSADGTRVSSVDALDALLEAGGETLEITIRRQNRELKVTLPCR